MFKLGWLHVDLVALSQVNRVAKTSPEVCPFSLLHWPLGSTWDPSSDIPEIRPIPLVLFMFGWKQL